MNYSTLVLKQRLKELSGDYERIVSLFNGHPTATHKQEYNDALEAIKSRMLELEETIEILKYL